MSDRFAKAKVTNIGQANRVIQALQARVAYLEDSLTAGTGSLWDKEVNIFCEIVLRNKKPVDHDSERV